MISTVSAKTEAGKENVFTQVREVKNVLIIAITSDRGLCGAFNANIGKATIALINEKYASQNEAGNVQILALGKKGAEYLGRRGYQIDSTHMEIFGKLSFTNVRNIGEELLDGFASKKYDVVEVVFNEFKNVATQIIRTEQLLPLVEQSSDSSTASAVDYIFEPTKEYIVQELIPKSLKIQFYKALLDSFASEHGARMTAMHKATDNAKELLRDLKISYNKARQAAITTEILEIVAGAEALNG